MCWPWAWALAFGLEPWGGRFCGFGWGFYRKFAEFCGSCCVHFQNFSNFYEKLQKNTFQPAQNGLK
jgi:hypothetical protein